MAGTALLIAAVAVLLAIGFARRIAREIGYLARTARKLADEELPLAVERIHDGGQAPGEVSVTPPRRRTTAEVVTAAAAIVNIHDSAVTAAVAEAGLRDGLRQVLVSLGRRNQSLVHRQLRIIDRLEQHANNSSDLAELFTLDHLTTRMRRHAESLTVLAGEVPGRSTSEPVPVVDVMRAAAAEVEDYKRVLVRSQAAEAIAAPAVTDMIHLLSELVENATLFSPSSTKVEVRAESVANGFVIEVEDRGLGIPPEQLVPLNERLANPPEIDLADADRLGLFVAGKLAARHGVQVSLAPSPYRGTKAIVILPEDILVAAAAHPSRPETPRQFGRLNLRAPGVLKLAGGDSQDGTGPDRGAGARTGAGSQSGKGPQPQGSAGTLAGSGWKLPVRRRPARDETPDPPRAPARSGASPAAGSGPPAVGRPSLPRRIRPDETTSASPDARPIASDRIDRAGRKPRQAPDSPLPEEARSLAASVQLSWRTGRQAADTGAEPENEEAP
jgi:signal transduction histidine kinase